MNETLQNASPLRFDPLVGTHIDNACKEATALSVNKNREVHFKFNDVDLVATPSKSWRELACDYDRTCAKRAKEYRESPEGKTAEAHRAAEIERNQIAVRALLRALPAELETRNLDKAVRWLKAFTEPADDVAVKFDRKALAQTFIAYGYREDEHVGESREWFNTRERIGRYLIGQAISCLKNGMPPHPRTLYFCDKYFATPKRRQAHSVVNGNEEHLAALDKQKGREAVSGIPT